MPLLSLLTILDKIYLTGPVPAELAELSQLTSLYLGEMLPMGKSRADGPTANTSCFVFLGYNQLTGLIPTELLRSTQLSVLYLSKDLLLQTWIVIEDLLAFED